MKIYIKKPHQLYTKCAVVTLSPVFFERKYVAIVNSIYLVGMNNVHVLFSTGFQDIPNIRWTSLQEQENFYILR